MSFTAHQATAYDYTAAAPTGDAYTLSGGPSVEFGTTDGDNVVRAIHQMLYSAKDYRVACIPTANLNSLWFIPTDDPPNYSSLDEQWQIDVFFETAPLAKALLGSEVLPTDEQDFIPSPDWTDVVEYPWLSNLHEDEVVVSSRIGYARMQYHSAGLVDVVSVDETADLSLTKLRVAWATGASSGSPPTFHGDDFYPALLFDLEIALPGWSTLSTPCPSPWTDDVGLIKGDNQGNYLGRVIRCRAVMTDRTLVFDGEANPDFGTLAAGVVANYLSADEINLNLTPETAFPYTP